MHKYSHLKRFIERNTIGGLYKDFGDIWCEKHMKGFWDILAEYFTHE